MAKISIVIPVYNAEKFVKETLDSVTNQTFTDFECVIVNDGSKDNSLDIINDFVLTDCRFKCFTIDNSGCADIPIKHGVKNSVGDFIMVIGHDDSLDSSCLERMYIKQLETNADIVILTLVGCLNELEGELYRLPILNLDVNKTYSGIEACGMTIGGWKFTCNGMLVKKSLYDGIPVGAYMNSDELSSRYLLYKAETVSFSNATYYYRNHLNSISRAVSVRIFEKLIVDSQLNDFVDLRYSENSGVAKQMRITRFFNLIYLQADFVNNINCFSKLQRVAVNEIIKKSYKTQNFLKLTEELPRQFKFLFLKSYQMFRINAIIYVFVKSLKGRTYILK